MPIYLTHGKVTPRPMCDPTKEISFPGCILFLCQVLKLCVERNAVCRLFACRRKLGWVDQHVVLMVGKIFGMKGAACGPNV